MPCDGAIFVINIISATIFVSYFIPISRNDPLLMDFKKNTLNEDELWLLTAVCVVLSMSSYGYDPMMQ